jgi:hypothetical protein
MTALKAFSAYCAEVRLYSKRVSVASPDDAPGRLGVLGWHVRCQGYKGRALARHGVLVSKGPKGDFGTPYSGE